MRDDDVAQSGQSTRHPEPAEQASFREWAREELRRAYRWPRTLFPVLLFVLATWGTWDSFHDGDGDRILGTFTFLAPVVLVGWHVTALGWRPGMTFGAGVGRAVVQGLVLPIPLALANSLVVLVAWMVPAQRAAVENYEGNHYYVPDLGEHLMIASIGTVIIAFGIALLVFMALTLPILVLRTPERVAAGTRVARARSARLRRVSITLLVLGLSLWVQGAVVASFTRGTDYLLLDYRTISRNLPDGPVAALDMAWFVGVNVALIGAVAIIAGGLVMVVGIIAGRHRRS